FHFARATHFPRFALYRAGWLLRLLCGHAEAAAERYEPKVVGELDAKRLERICQSGRKEPGVALFWSLYALVFDDPGLDQLLRVLADTPSRLVRDAAALVGELARGRKQLGAIEDFAELKRRFLARNPKANRDADAEPQA